MQHQTVFICHFSAAKPSLPFLWSIPPPEKTKLNCFWSPREAKEQCLWARWCSSLKPNSHSCVCRREKSVLCSKSSYVFTILEWCKSDWSPPELLLYALQIFDAFWRVACCGLYWSTNFKVIFGFSLSLLDQELMCNRTYILFLFLHFGNLLEGNTVDILRTYSVSLKIKIEKAPHQLGPPHM